MKLSRETMTPEERERLVLDNMKLVPHIARELTRDADLIDEIIGEGYEGLIEASHKYQDDKGKFQSYAGTIIRNRMKKYLLKLPKNQVSFDSIASSDGSTLDDSMADPLAVNAEHNIIKKELVEAMNKGIGLLHTREAWLIKRHYGLDGFDPMTMQELGDYIGSSKQYVYQLIQESLKFLQKYIKSA